MFNNTTILKTVSQENWCVNYSATFLSTKAGKINLIAFCVASLLCCIVSVVLNTIYICAVLRSKTLRKSVNDLYLMLSICDLVSGLSLMPVYSLWLDGFVRENPRCFLINIWTVMAYSFIMMSVTAIGLITLEIYIAVFKPFSYKYITKKRLLTLSLLCLWIPSVVFPTLSVYVFPDTISIMRAVSTVYALVIFLTMIVCQKRIYGYIRANESKCSNQRKKAARVALQILLAYGLCSVPAVMANVINRLFFDSVIIDNYVNRWCNFLVLSYSLWDTFIYGYRSSRVRKEVLKMLSCGYVVNPYISQQENRKSGAFVVSNNL